MIALFLYAVVFPLCLAFYVRRQRAAGIVGGPLNFLTGHLRARTWWYEIAALVGLDRYCLPCHPPPFIPLLLEVDVIA